MLSYLKIRNIFYYTLVLYSLFPYIISLKFIFVCNIIQETYFVSKQVAISGIIKLFLIDLKCHLYYIVNSHTQYSLCFALIYLPISPSVPHFPLIKIYGASLSPLLFFVSHYFLGHFTDLILEMKFRISTSCYKTTTNPKKQTNQKEILDGFLLNLCINL